MSGTINKKLFILSCFLLLAPSPLFADDSGQTLGTQKEKESYSIGYQVGLSMKNDGVEVDFDKLIQGLHDAIDEKKPQLSMDEMRKLIVALKEKARDEALKKIRELRAKNAEEAEKFFAENAKKEGVKTTESGLQYKIIKEGEGESPKIDDFVTVHYRGTFPDGTEFDSSYARGEPQRFQTDGVIKGWTEALQMMKVGSKWEIFVPPHLAYGRSGFEGRIPPNQMLIFQIELIAIEKQNKTGG